VLQRVVVYTPIEISMGKFKEINSKVPDLSNSKNFEETATFTPRY
jgi:hypothetical protein